MRRTQKYGAVTKDEAKRSPSALLRAVSMSNDRWTFYEAVKLVGVGYFLDEDDSFWAKWSDHAHSLNTFLDGTDHLNRKGMRGTENGKN